MKILVACDKFRGSLTANEANAAIVAAVRDSALGARATCQSVPIADGGEGTLDALASDDSELCVRPVRGPFGEAAEGAFLFDPSRRRAIIEMAAVAGHPAATRHGYDPDRATSQGVGDLIRAALDKGAREVVVSLGGSITVDGGAGALEALGARYRDTAGAPIEAAAGRRLADIAVVDLSGIDPRAKTLAIVIAADVDNPLAGARGAAAVFGPQKGVARDDIGAFDAALVAFDAAVARAMGRETFVDTPFAGAAGGMMTGLSAIAPTTARDGFALVSEHHDMARRVAAADLVVTGEGSLDAQSLGGKGPVAIARMARDAGVPALAFAGRLAATPRELAAHGIVAAFSISQGPQSLEEALAGAADALRATATGAFNLYAAGHDSRT
ncbi:MAG: glycerate kinase [Acuticoccus sp.]